MAEIIKNTFAKCLKDGQFIDNELMIKPLSDSKPPNRIYEKVCKLNDIWDLIALNYALLERPSPYNIINYETDLKNPDAFKEERDRIRKYVKKITICVKDIEGIHSASSEDAKWMIETFIENLWKSFSVEDIKYISKRCETKVYKTTRLIYWHDDESIVKAAREREIDIKTKIRKLREKIEQSEIDRKRRTKLLEDIQNEYNNIFINITSNASSIHDVTDQPEILIDPIGSNHKLKGRAQSSSMKNLINEFYELRKHYAELMKSGFKPVLDSKLEAHDIWSLCYAELLSDIECKWPVFKCADHTCHNHDKYYVGKPFPSANGVFCSTSCRDREKLRQHRKNNT